MNKEILEYNKLPEGKTQEVDLYANNHEYRSIPRYG